MEFRQTKNPCPSGRFGFIYISEHESPNHGAATNLKKTKYCIFFCTWQWRPSVWNHANQLPKPNSRNAKPKCKRLPKLDMNLGSPLNFGANCFSEVLSETVKFCVFWLLPRFGTFRFHNLTTKSQPSYIWSQVCVRCAEDNVQTPTEETTGHPRRKVANQNGTSPFFWFLE